MAQTSYKRASKGTTNISERVYTILHKNIVNLNLAPGTMISEKEIASRLKVSRTPVREAFIRLSYEALITRFPQKGTFVSKIDLSRVQEEQFLRESLESSVVQLFANHHTEESIDRLRMSIKKQQTVFKEKDYDKFIDYDDQFHYIMFDETKKHLSYKVLNSFSSHYKRIRYLSMYIIDGSDENIQQHIDLVKAVVQHEAEKASTILKNHTGKLFIEKDEICKRYPKYFQKEEQFIDDLEIFDESSSFKNILLDPSLLKM